MTRSRAPLVGWGAFLLAVGAASASGSGAQLAFAAGAIVMLGLPHGAGDLAVVPPGRRASFLLLYGVVIVSVLALWLAAPAIGLAVLLLCSAIHFSLDDPGQRGQVAAWSTGLCLVGAPAVMHREEVAALFADITGTALVSGEIAALLQAIGLVALTVAVVATVRDPNRAVGARGGTLLVLAAVASLPPLVGFATGFVLLHARGQTEERRRALGCASMAAYLRRVAPVLAGAAVALGGIAAVFAGRPHADIMTLFAAIAALAMPHMIVTPLSLRGETRFPATRSGVVAAFGAG